MKLRSARIIKALAILLVVLAALYAVAWLWIARSLRQTYAELEADGRPMTMRDIELDPVPPSQNAAPLYQAALLLLQSEPFGDVSMQDHLAAITRVQTDDPRSPEAIETELRAALQQEVCVEALKLIEKGTTRPDYRFIGKASSDKYHSPLNIDNDNDSFRVAGMISLGQLLNARARIQMADGDLAGAWTTVHSSLRLAASFTKIPQWNGQTARLILASYAMKTARDLCPVSMPDPKQLEELQRLLRTFDDPAPIVHALDIERIVIDCLLFHPSSEESERLADPAILRGNGVPRHIYLHPVKLADYAYYLRIQLRVAHVIEQVDARNVPPPDEIFPQAPFLYRLSNGTLARLFPLTQMRKGFANARITSAGLAALKYHQEHGAFPAALAELGSLNLTDPFTGAALAYRVELDGFVISSAGPRAGPEDDIVWQYKTPTNASVPAAP